MNMVISTKNRLFLTLLGPSETKNVQPIYKWSKNGSFQPKYDKIHFFQHSHTLYDAMQKEIENLEFAQGVNFEFIDSLLKQRYKVLVNHWRFMWRDLLFKSICWYCYYWQTSWIEYYLHWAQLVSSKQAWAGRWGPEHAHCSFQVSSWCDPSQYIQCTIGTRIRAIWKVSRRNICSLRSFIDGLVATHRQSITFLYKHRIHSSKFYIPDRLKQSKFWTMNAQNLSTLQVFQSISHKIKSLFLQSCSK